MMSRNRQDLSDVSDNPQSENSNPADDGVQSYSRPESGPSDSVDNQYTASVTDEMRAVLSCLAATGGCLPLIQLSRAVAQEREEADGGDIAPATLQRYYLELRAVTVDELEQRELVTYCDVDGIVQLTPTGEKYVAYSSL